MYKGDSLYLQKISLSDIDDNVINWFNDDDLMKFYTNSKNKISRETLLNSIVEGEKNGNMFTYGIFYIENNELIGTIKIGPINFHHLTSDMVVLIGNKNYHGKGLAVEAIKIGNILAFEKYKIRKLYGGMYESNLASLKAYTKAGWIIEGRLKGQFLVNQVKEDRILVACFNPLHFSEQEIQILKSNESRYYQF